MLSHRQLLLRRTLSDQLERFPLLYTSIMKLRYRGTPVAQRIISKDTDIVIEGFPRSANSFAVRAFRMANDPEGKMKIATHIHSPAQIILGVKWKIPTLVLIRHPDDAVVSFPALAMELNKHGLANASETFLEGQIEYWLRRYIQFYRRLTSVRKNICVVDFKDVITDFGAAILNLNTQFEKKYKLFDHSIINVERMFTISQKHLSPSPERDQIKNTIRTIYKNKRYEPLRVIALQHYQSFHKNI